MRGKGSWKLHEKTWQNLAYFSFLSFRLVFSPFSFPWTSASQFTSTQTLFKNKEHSKGNGDWFYFSTISTAKKENDLPVLEVKEKAKGERMKKKERRDDTSSLWTIKFLSSPLFFGKRLCLGSSSSFFLFFFLPFAHPLSKGINEAKGGKKQRKRQKKV